MRTYATASLYLKVRKLLINMQLLNFSMISLLILEVSWRNPFQKLLHPFDTFFKSPASSSLSLHYTHPQEVYKGISNLENKSSAGVDCIPVSIMKVAATYISESIAKIINASLRAGIFSDSLKVSQNLSNL